MKKYRALIVCLILFIFGCNKQDNIQSELKEPPIIDAKEKETIYIGKYSIPIVKDENVNNARTIDELNFIPSIDELIDTHFILGTLKFGKYEQDNNIENGLEDIEWFVIDTEKDNPNKCLLLSKYILDYRMFDKNVNNEICNYSNSDIRYFLNYYFYNKSFNSDEKEVILQSEYDDKIFLINKSELPFFIDGCHTIATTYAKNKKIEVYNNEDIKNSIQGNWDENLYIGISPYYYRDLRYSNYRTDINNASKEVSGIRPAMWVDFSNYNEYIEKTNMIAKYQDIKDIFYYGCNRICFGKNNMEWVVCKKENSMALLRAWRPVMFIDEYEGDNWDKSELREYLNNDFVDNNFDAKDKNRIIPTKTLSNRGYQQGYRTFSQIEIYETIDKLYMPDDSEFSAYEHGLENYEDYKYYDIYNNYHLCNNEKQYPYDNEIHYLKSNGSTGIIETTENIENKKAVAIIPMMWVTINDEN